MVNDPLLNVRLYSPLFSSYLHIFFVTNFFNYFIYSDASSLPFLLLLLKTSQSVFYYFLIMSSVCVCSYYMKDVFVNMKFESTNLSQNYRNFIMLYLYKLHCASYTVILYTCAFQHYFFINNNIIM